MMASCMVQGHTVANEPLSYAGHVFSYSNTGGSNSQEIHNTSGVTGNTFLYYIPFLVILELNFLVLLVLHSMQTQHFLHGKKPLRSPNMIGTRGLSMGLGATISLRLCALL